MKAKQGKQAATRNGAIVGEVLTLSEAARLLRVGDAALEQLAKTDRIPCRLIAGEFRFSRSALLDWLRVGDDQKAKLRRLAGKYKGDELLDEIDRAAKERRLRDAL
ncbi:MAG: helix-turn-helix domain-containing protein [Gemmataceae bacterium]